MILFHCLERSLESSVKRGRYHFLIPALAKTLITMEGGRLAGIKLLNRHCRRVFDFDFSSDSEHLKDWMQKNEIYKAVLCPEITEEEYEESKSLLKYFGRSATGKGRTTDTLSLLQSNRSRNRWISRFCLRRIEVHAMNNEEKKLLVEYLRGQDDLAENYAEYSEVLDELVYRLDYSEDIIEPVFHILYGIIRQAYFSLGESSQRRLYSNMRGTSRHMRAFLNKMKNEEKVDYLKKLSTELLVCVDRSSILLFNLVFSEGEIFKACSNNPFQSIMNFIIE